VRDVQTFEKFLFGCRFFSQDLRRWEIRSAPRPEIFAHCCPLLVLDHLPDFDRFPTISGLRFRRDSRRLDQLRRESDGDAEEAGDNDDDGGDDDDGRRVHPDDEDDDDDYEYEEGDEDPDLAGGAANATLQDQGFNTGAGATGVPEVIPEEPGY